jgi:SAM-dependent methyltransferase
MSRPPVATAISRNSRQPASAEAISFAELPELVRWVASRVKVLEVGSGGGANALWLAEQGYHATVVEPSLQRSRQLRREAEARGLKLRVLQQDTGRLRLTGTYDIVVAQLGVPELPMAELAELIHEVRSRTRRRGFNVVALAVQSNGAQLSAEPGPAEPGLTQAICGLYAGWRLLSQRSYLSADDLGGRRDLIRLIAQRRA